MSTLTDQPPSSTRVSDQDASTLEPGLLQMFISLFSSSGPYGDWLTIFVIGGVLELIRRLFVFGWKGLVNQFWITIALEEYDDSYGEY